eukprot:1759954-Ditylum_brightwellii.AAC.1
MLMPRSTFLQEMAIFIAPKMNFAGSGAPNVNPGDLKRSPLASVDPTTTKVIVLQQTMPA